MAKLAINGGKPCIKKPARTKWPIVDKRDVQQMADVVRAGRGAIVYTKSGLMVGLGETHGEVSVVLRDLRAAGCEMLTIGQYLAPSPAHVPVERFVEPPEFAAWEDEARTIGFAAVAAGPFVRSSYKAEQLIEL